MRNGAYHGLGDLILSITSRVGEREGIGSGLALLEPELSLFSLNLRTNKSNFRRWVPQLTVP